MNLANCSELQETSALLRRFSLSGRTLLSRPAPLRRPTPTTPATQAIPAAKPTFPSPAAPPIPAPAAPASPPPQARKPAGEFRGGRIEEILESMCLRGRFHGAVVADEGGLAVAEYNCPVGTDAVAACSSILGTAMTRAGDLLEQQDANHMTMDINYVDKVVLRRFAIEDAFYYLMIICPQEVDERSELELSIDRVLGVLSRRP